MNNTLLYSLLMILAGLGIPVMAALNGALGAKLQSPAMATAILFLVGFIIASLYLVISNGIPSTLYVESAPWYYYFGGFFVAFYILSITWVAPRLGVSNAVALVLFGQLVAMSLIDHFGLFRAPEYSLTSKRAVGLVLMALGVLMVLSKPQEVQV